jgi:polyphosphate kinase
MATDKTTVEKIMSDMIASGGTSIEIDGKARKFDINDPILPEWVEKKALSSGHHPYDKKLNQERYDAELRSLQIELVKVQFWLKATGQRVMALFEGRDAAGKGGTIHAILSYMNPRSARNVALTKPTETEQGQWYFQRYINEFPSGGEFVLFDRSWYNRAVVEPVMGFCTQDQYKHFMEQVPRFEKLIQQDNIHFFKFWLDIGREMQIKRFHDRRHDPLKVWKLSAMDIAALNRWDDYTEKRDRMLKETHTKEAPWTVVKANDKRRAHLNAIRHLLLSLEYTDKDINAIGEIDPKILGKPSDVL